MPLPGYEAQVRMSPSHRAFTPPPGKDTPFVGAVMLLLYPGDENTDLFVVLTVRTDNVTVHKGQVSLPGGSIEPEDVSLAQTALREVCEELGICGDDIDIIGELTPIYIEPSNFHVHPFVAYLPYRPSFVMQEREVLHVLEVPITHFIDPKNMNIENWMIEGAQRRIPYFDIYGKKVWGATAIIISEFVAVLEKIDERSETCS
ncbi:MAG: hydrolase [Deltaproteobacteria bacterium]|nr:hydrolase [Deltaproteobacteria bacterium]